MEYNQLEQAKNTDNLVEFYEKYNEQWRVMIDSSPVEYLIMSLWKAERVKLMILVSNYLVIFVVSLRIMFVLGFYHL